MKEHTTPMTTKNPISKKNFITKKLLLLTLTALTKSLNFKAKYKFEKKISNSKKKIYRRIEPGPLPNTSALCTSNSECFILSAKNPQKILWSTSESASIYAYTNQKLHKTLITGFPTYILDFNNPKNLENDLNTEKLNFQNKFKKKKISPSVVINCVYTKSIYWICISGSGSYFLLDMTQETNVLTYKSGSSSSLSHISEKSCSSVNGGYWIYCTRIQGRNNLMLNILDLKSKFIQYDIFFREYKNNGKPIKLPNGATGSESDGEFLDVWVSGGKKISNFLVNFTSGETLNSFSLNEDSGIESTANIEFGIFLLVKNSKIKILNLKDGTLITSFNANVWNCIIGKDQRIYFSDLNDHYYKSISFKISNKNLNNYEAETGCKKYNFGVDSCLSCSQNFTKNFLEKSTTKLKCEKRKPKPPPKKPVSPPKNSNSNGVNNTKPGDVKKPNNFTKPLGNGNNIPGVNLNKLIFLDPKKFDIDIAESSDSRALIEFRNLGSASNEEKQKYIASFFGKKIYFLLVNKKDKKWRQDENVEFKVMKYAGLWREGKILLKIIYKKNFEKMSTKFHLVAPDYISKSRILQNTALKPGSKVYPKKPKNHHKDFLILPSHLKTPEILRFLSFLLFGAIKLIITFLQILLIFLIPFKEKTLQNFLHIKKPIPPTRWLTWHASSLLTLQTFLLTGLVPGNFGGFLNKINIEKFTQFRDYLFLVKPRINFPYGYQILTQGALLPNFEQIEYLYSPLQETPIESLIFFIGIFLSIFLSMAGGKNKAQAWYLRFGISISFMIPLVLSSTTCLYKILLLLSKGLLEEFKVKKIISLHNLQPLKNTTGSTRSQPLMDDSTQGNFGFFGFFSLLCSVLILGYYILFVLGNVFNIKSDCHGNENTTELDKLNEEIQIEEEKFNYEKNWNYFCFDVDEFVWFKRKFVNFYEFFQAFLLPALIALSSNYPVYSFYVYFLFSGLNLFFHSSKIQRRGEKIYEERENLYKILKEKKLKEFKEKSLNMNKNQSNVPKHLRIKSLEPKMIKEKNKRNEKLHVRRVDFGKEFTSLLKLKSYSAALNFLTFFIFWILWMTSHSRTLNGTFWVTIFSILIQIMNIIIEIWILIFRNITKLKPYHVISMETINSLTRKREERKEKRKEVEKEDSEWDMDLEIKDERNFEEGRVMTEHQNAQLVEVEGSRSVFEEVHVDDGTGNIEIRGGGVVLTTERGLIQDDEDIGVREELG